jgi:hypothetical protein
MKKFLFCFVTVLLLSGCSVSNKVWKYTSEPKVYKKANINATIQIPVFRDERTSEANTIMSGGKFLLAMLPLVPYTTVTDLNVPEGQLPKAPEIFAKATGEELANASIFKDVIILPSSQEFKADYLLEGTLQNTNTQQTISYYGLSLPGDLLWLLGAPPGQGSNKLVIRYRLLDKKYNVLLDKIYEKDRKWWLSFYSQEIIHFYAEMYKEINQELIKDIEKALKFSKADD